MYLSQLAHMSVCAYVYMMLFICVQYQHIYIRFTPECFFLTPDVQNKEKRREKVTKLSQVTGGGGGASAGATSLMSSHWMLTYSCLIRINQMHLSRDLGLYLPKKQLFSNLLNLYSIVI